MLTFAKQFNLTAKFLPPILGTALIVLLAGVFLLFQQTRDTNAQQVEIAQAALYAEQKHAQIALTETLNSKADIIGRFMAKTTPDLILSSDFTALKAYQADATRDKEVLYAAYLKPDGTPLTDFQRPEGGGPCRRTGPRIRRRR